MKKIFTLITLIMGALGMMAEEVTFNFSTSVPKEWNSNPAPTGFETSGTMRGAQYNMALKQATLTLSGVKDVTKVVVTCSSNADGKNALSLSVGGNSWGSETLAKENLVEKTFTGSAASGDLVLSITLEEKSVWISKVVVTGNVEGGQEGGGGDEKDPVDLDPKYEYDEPTTVEPSGAIGSNAAYSFVSNNVKVECTTGGQTADYFGCNAGHRLTFTATQPIKGITVNGYVKQGFSASADHGDILYVDATDEEVTNDPVLVLTDVDSKTVTITCVKQMRCYSVDIYFEENPEVTPGGEEEELTYEWEPTEVTTLNETMLYADYTDYEPLIGLALTELYLDNDGKALDLWVYAPAVAGTGIAPGTYPIDFSDEPGTVMASAGGNDYEDYPSYLACYSYDADYEDYIYDCAYYLVSGTLKVEAIEGGAKLTLDAKSYNGSTIKVTYEGPINEYSDGELDGVNQIALTTTATPSKQLVNGHIVIRHSGHTFDLMGKQIR